MSFIDPASPSSASSGSASPSLGPQSQPIGYAQVPQSTLLAQALRGMAAQPQGNVAGLSSNLLAQALLQYRQQMQAQQQQGAAATAVSSTTPPGSFSWPTTSP